MPRIKSLTVRGQLQDSIKDLTRKTKHQLSDNRISQKKLAEVAGISEQAVSNQFSKDRITLEVYLAAQMLLKDK